MHLILMFGILAFTNLVASQRSCRSDSDCPSGFQCIFLTGFNRYVCSPKRPGGFRSAPVRPEGMDYGMTSKGMMHHKEKCRSNADCGGGERCYFGLCIEAGMDYGTVCYLNQGCPPGQICYNPKPFGRCTTVGRK